MKAIVSLGTLPTFAADGDILARRDALMTECRAITQIGDQVDADCAGRVLQEAVTLTRGVEKSRSEVKAPVLDLGRAIDGVARNITEPLQAEVNRLQRLLGSWLEARRREQAEAEVRVRQAEAERLAAAAQEPDPGKAAETMRQAVLETNAALAQAAPPKIEGAGLRVQVTVEVFNPAALYAVRPDLVELKPRLAAIKEALVTNPGLPGVRVLTAPVATVRRTHA